MIEIARADPEALRHVGLRQILVPPQAAKSLAEEELGGHYAEAVNKRQKTQVKL